MTRIIKADSEMQTGQIKAAMLNLSDFADEARELVLEARTTAARITDEAREKAENILRESTQQGYAEGFVNGQNDGYVDGQKKAMAEAAEKFKKQYTELLSVATEIVQSLASTRDEGIQHACSEILEMAVMLAERIVGRVAAADISAARANLAKVLELAHYGGQVVVKVNHIQLSALRSCFRELVDAVGVGGPVKLVGDETISPGGVKLISPHGRIDATIEAQLDNAAKALLGRQVSGRYESDLADEPVTHNDKDTVRTHGSV